MMTPRPRLYTFGISHYCEKARWALDWHAIDYDEVRWPPGPHLILARRLRTVETSVPILQDGDQVIQGSGQIIDWAVRKAERGGASLDPDCDPERAHEIERRADEVLGVQVRRLAYAETLTDHPEVVKPALFAGVAPGLRLLGEVMWPVTRKAMIAMMDAGPRAAPDSRGKVERELDWLEEGLSRGTGFPAGERFSRVDLTVASLLAPFARPAETELYRDMVFPEALAGALERWRTRPAITWVRTIYRDYRRAAPRGLPSEYFGNMQREVSIPQ